MAKPRGWGEVGGMELLGGNEMTMVTASVADTAEEVCWGAVVREWDEVRGSQGGKKSHKMET